MNRYVIFAVFIISISLGLMGTAFGESYIIGPEDMLQISVWGSPELNVHIPVRPDGMISVPLIGDIKADGLTPTELKLVMEKQYSKFIKTPTVSVIVTAVNSFKIYIVGGGISSGQATSAGAGTGSSGAISLRKNTTLMQLLAQFGSLQGADLKSSHLLRAGNKLNVDFAKLINEGDVSQDIQLQRDDVIFIPPDLTSRIKVVGAVRTPGLMPYFKGMTALDAVLSSGGFTEFASQNNVVIVRQEGSEIKNIVVRLKDVIKGGDMSKNETLKPGDLINVKSGIF
jgi:polysaccharide export outer membrane protein